MDYKFNLAAFRNAGLDPDTTESRYGVALSALINLLEEGEISNDSKTLQFLHSFLSSIELNIADVELYKVLDNYMYPPLQVFHMKLEKE